MNVKKTFTCSIHVNIYLHSKKCFHLQNFISNSNKILSTNIKTNIVDMMLQVHFFHLYEQQREFNSRWTTKNIHLWMNKRMNNKECSFKKFMFVKCLANILHFTKHDNHLYDCSWTNRNFIHVNKKDSHHRENYMFIQTNNFIELRFSTNDCKMYDYSNIL